MILVGQISKTNSILMPKSGLQVMKILVIRMIFSYVAVGNVPFGNYQVYDRRYERHHFMIHDYFLAKTLDQLRSGGVAAFITSKGTMDKKSDTVRLYLSQEPSFWAQFDCRTLRSKRMQEQK